ncbi:MAG: type II toxin-antitoxin system RelE/ParE family toxin [Magnetococcales bacterium]|nr:type II toxin-antitoxin system RelE/ParE family toxin [Magnetococcales bacterium]
MNWRIEYLSKPVQKEIESWPVDMQAKLYRIIELIHEFGLHRVREPYIMHLHGKLWEMWVKGRDGIARAIYVTAHAKRVVIVHAFKKKTQKTPKQEIRLALERIKEIKS